jgi:hypothetical protein
MYQSIIPGKKQHLLAISLVIASITSCKKEITEPPAEITLNNITENATVSARSITNLIWSDNIDGSLFFNLGVSKQTSTSYGITAVTNPYYQGVRSARFELRNTDKEANGGTRSEISVPLSGSLNRWYSYAVYAPADKFKYDKIDDVITQWHQGGGETPALCLRVRADRIYIRILGEWFDLGVFDKDKWHAYVMHIKHSTGSDGLIELWRDGKQIMKRSGPNMYKISGTFHHPGLKFGIYKSAWNGSSTTATSVRVIYFDDIRIGNEYATYATMAPTPSGNQPTDPEEGNENNTSGVSVTDFKLVNAATEKEVQSIVNGQTISLSALKLSKTNIRAVVSSGAKSVKFVLSGKQSRSYTDNKAPFALHGDDSDGNYYYGNWAPPAVGTYTLKATPYTDAKAGGTAGTAKTITFTIVK